MAYNNGFPMGYPQMYPQYFTPQLQQTQPQVVQQQTQVTDNGILWVQGEAGAKSWAVAPGKSVMLMDSESNTFYIKRCCIYKSERTLSRDKRVYTNIV